MAKTKADWIKEAKSLGLKVTTKDKIADIKAAIGANSNKKPFKKSELQPETVKEEPSSVKPTKAGKRSAKAIREADELAAKEARKTAKAKDDGKSTDQADTAPERGPVPKPRPQIERRGKKYREAFKQIEANRSYELKPAIELALSSSTTKFDSTVELHIRLGVDPRQADQNVRGTVILPNGSGRNIRVAAFVPADKVSQAKSAGADIVGEADFLEKLKKEELDFDVLISTPAMMSQLGKFAKLLGPKGLMPNPKSGTVTNNIKQAITEAKSGRVEYRIDKQGIVHVPVGKVSFGTKKIIENVNAIVGSIKAAKPSTLKGNYIISITIATTMGPGIHIDVAKALEAV